MLARRYSVDDVLMMRAHPTGIGLAGMMSELRANIELSDSRPFARLMSDTYSMHRQSSRMRLEETKNVQH